MAMEKLDYAQAEAVATAIGAEATKMKNTLDAIKNEFKIAGSDNWNGQAANDIKAKLATFSAKFESFYEAVKSEQTYLKGVVADYKAAEAKAQELLG